MYSLDDKDELIDAILKCKDKQTEEYLIERLRDTNFKYHLLNEVLNNNILNQDLVQISSNETAYEVFAESLLGMSKEKFDNILSNLSKKKKKEYIQKNYMTMNCSCDFENNLINEYIEEVAVKGFYEKVTLLNRRPTSPEVKIKMYLICIIKKQAFTKNVDAKVLISELSELFSIQNCEEKEIENIENVVTETIEKIKVNKRWLNLSFFLFLILILCNN